MTAQEYRRRAILDLLHQNGGVVTKKQVVERLGGTYYCNAEKHLGDILSRMVNRGTLERVRPGYFVLGAGKKNIKSEVAEQLNLFKS